jgi:hypothetical protein
MEILFSSVNVKMCNFFDNKLRRDPRRNVGLEWNLYLYVVKMKNWCNLLRKNKNSK